jgi:hypothetical protein
MCTIRELHALEIAALEAVTKYSNSELKITHRNICFRRVRKADGMYDLDWHRYEQTTRLSSRFLDNIIDQRGKQLIIDDNKKIADYRLKIYPLLLLKKK